MIVKSPFDFVPLCVLIKIPIFARTDVAFYLKNEVFNPAGSIKFKPAVGIVRELEARRDLGPGQGLIDTSSGNMAIALSIVARARGYPFVCVCDDKVTEHNRRLLSVYGTEVVVMPTSTLADRYRHIEERIRSDPSLVWTRQFSNLSNPAAHELTTAREVLSELPDLTHLFVGTGTAGTLAGCSQVLSRHRPAVRLTAVDVFGSRHFSAREVASKRLLPGIGATERSPFLMNAAFDDVIFVNECDAIAACKELVEKTGWLFGASTGSVLSAIRESQDRFAAGDVVVGIAADSGERYLDSVYNPSWIDAHFPSAPRPA